MVSKMNAFDIISRVFSLPQRYNINIISTIFQLTYQLYCLLRIRVSKIVALIMYVLVVLLLHKQQNE